MRGSDGWQVFRFELRQRFASWQTWIYFLIIAYFASGSVADASAAAGRSLLNGPYRLAASALQFSAFGILITAGYVGQTIHRDYRTGMYPLFFTSGVSRLGYLGGRLGGALLANAFILLGWLFGVIAGTMLASPGVVGPMVTMSYVGPYLLFMLPTLLFTGIVFFALPLLARRILPNYVAAIVLLMAYLAAKSFGQGIDSPLLASLLDPFGGQAFLQHTRYWTVAEQNTVQIGLTGYLLLNRLLWLAMGLVVASIVVWRFRFRHVGQARRWRGAGAVAEPDGSITPASHVPVATAVPARPRTHEMSYNVWSQLGALARTSFAGSVRNIYFAAMVVAGMAFLAWISTGIDVMPDATIYPETRRVTSYLGADFFLIQIIVIVYYSGELIWRERDCRVQQIHDALPVQAWITYAAKLVALAGVVILLQLVVLAVGITVQTLAGYHHYELWLYARELFGVQLIDLLLIAGLALFVQVLVDQRYIGYALLVLPWLLPGVQRFGIEHNLLVPGGDPGIDYSDLNGYGPFATPFVWFKSYWGALIVLLSFIAVLFQAHGEERLWRSRITLARRRLTRGSLAGMAVAIAGMIFCAGFIFYNTNVINTFRSSDVINADRATYERRYSQTGRLVPPAIRDMNVEVELYPGRGAARGRGTYTLVNESSRAIDSIVVTLPTKETETTSLEFDRPVETLQSDPVLSHTLHRLAEPLQPGDTLVLSFAVKHEHAGFTNTTDRLDVVRNGTFVSHDRLFPRIGYDRSRELVNPQVRAGFGLPPRRDPASDDAQARLRNEIGLGSWSTFEAVVSTRADQIALAPGSLVEKWEDGRRRYFRYSSRGQRMLPSPAYMSARYGVARDRWGDVDLEVYYHPGHEYDIGRFMEAMKQALSYNTAAVGPYPFGTARIVEAPHYEIAAQALPGMIPYSEDVGFIARIDGRKTGAVDYPFVNTAHEMAHQWWANQVIGADVPGSKVLTETLASYSALRVYERALGPERTRQYLAGQRDRYLAGRRRDRRGELPLLSVESRHGYVYYNKGTLVFHALADLIGEDRLDGALREFFTANRFRPAPFPTTAQLYERLRAATPDSLRYFLADAFEHITLYDLRVTGATVTSLDGGANRVDIDIDARKMHADEDGNTVDAPMEDWIDVGVFGAGPRRDPLHLRKHRLRSGVQHISVVVEGEPRRVVIDPDLMLIERNLRDNSAITQSPGTATTNGSTTAIGGQFHLMLSEAETHATRQPTRHQDLLYRQPR